MSIINFVGGKSESANSNSIIVSDAIANLVEGDSGSLQEFIEAIASRQDIADIAISELITNKGKPTSAGRNFYLNADTGSDTNDGLTSGTAYASVDKIISELRKYYWTSSCTVRVSGATSLASNLNFNGIDIDISNNSNFTLILGTANTINNRYTGTLTVRNFNRVALSRFFADDVSLNFFDINFLLLGSSCVFESISGSNTLFNFENIGNVDFRTSASYPNFVSKTGTLFKYSNVAYGYLDLSFLTGSKIIDYFLVSNQSNIELENSALNITGARFELIDSNLTLSNINNITATAEDYLITSNIFNLSDFKDYNYDNSVTNLDAVNYQEGIDELATRDRPFTQRFAGLVPTINTDTTKWQFTSGLGQIADSYTNPLLAVIRNISYVSTQVVNKPAILNGSVTSCYAYLFWNGTAIVIGYQEAAPVAADLVDKLFLCAIISNDGINISEIKPISLSDDGETKGLLNYGAVNVDHAKLIPISSTMRLSFPGGRFKFAGRNSYNNLKDPHTISLNAIAEISYILCDPDGNVLSSNNLDFNFNQQWDTQNNQIILLSQNTYASSQFVYVFPSGAIAVVLGINEYTSLNLAASTWHFHENRLPNKFRNNSYFLGTIVGLANATNINNKEEVLLINGTN